MTKTLLIVYAHSESTSFNAALKDVAVETLTAHGYKILMSDLYAMEFNPVISKNDIQGPPKNPNHFNYTEELAIAWSEGRVAEDIKAEQAKVSAADLVIFQFPLHSMGLPAILKGWCDRTFLPGYAFSETEMYDNGRLKGKKAMFSITTGSPEDYYTTWGPNGDINVLLWPLQNGILRVVGFEVLPPFITYSPQLATEESRRNTLTKYRQRLENIFNDVPIYFIPIAKFSDNTESKDMKLSKRAVTEEEVDTDYGLTVGQHCNRKVPVNSMTQARPKHSADRDKQTASISVTSRV